MRYVVGFAFDWECESVLLIRKNCPQWQAGLLNGVGGKIEIGESPAAAMVREFREEAQMVVQREYWLRYHYERFASGTEIYFYATTCNIQNARAGTDEKLEIVNVSDISNLKCVYNLAYLIPMAKTLLNANPADIPLES